MNFGTYFAEKRNDKEISLRRMARLLGISAPYLGDVEHGRRKPLEIEKLTKAMDILELSEEERNTMFDLAGEARDTVAPDLVEYIMTHKHVVKALRAARDLGATDEDWKTFIEKLKKKYKSTTVQSAQILTQ